jgi:hypothetical protein
MLTGAIFMADMPAATPRNHDKIPLADQLVVNLLAFLVVQRVQSNNTPLALDELRRVLPHASEGNPLIAPVAEAAWLVVQAAPDRAKASGATAWAVALMEASAALEPFFFRRAALAHNALNPYAEAAP